MSDWSYTTLKKSTGKSSRPSSKMLQVRADSLKYLKQKEHANDAFRCDVYRLSKSKDVAPHVRLVDHPKIILSSTANYSMNQSTRTQYHRPAIRRIMVQSVEAVIAFSGGK